MSAQLRAEQVGSLRRPDRLLDARSRRARGEIDDDELARVEDEAILEALAHQRATGIDVFVDGEFRRAGFMTGFPAALSGIEPSEGGAPLPWRGGSGDEGESVNTQWLIVERVHPTRRIAQREASFLAKHAPGPFKVTLPSPLLFAFAMWRKGVSDEAYPTPSEFLSDASTILADEVAALGAEGVPYIQIDAPSYTHWADASLRDGYASVGFDLDTMLDDAIAAENRILDAVPAGVLRAVHLCRGNSIGRWLAQGGYEAIAEKLFVQLRCERLLLEYDDERSGGFEPLRLVPAEKTVVLGLLTTKRGALEDRDEILRRVEQATRYVPLERLALSPQCGFASSGASNPISEEQQWRKLELVATIARELWGEPPSA
jgi:methionine synthase II (cobalamin-independent)